MLPSSISTRNYGTIGKLLHELKREKDEDIELQENEKDKMNSSGEPGKREKKNKKKVFKKKRSLKTKSQNPFLNDPYNGDNHN